MCVDLGQVSQSIGTWFGNPANAAKVATGLQAAGVISSSIGSYYKSKSDKAAYEYQAAAARNNAHVDELRARDSIVRGQIAEGNARLRTAATAGSQRAALAARGLALDEGSPLSILQDTAYMGELDALTIRDNAAREAWALREQSRGGLANAELLSTRAASESPFGAFGSTLLGGAGKVADTWYRHRTNTTKTA